MHLFNIFLKILPVIPIIPLVIIIANQTVATSLFKAAETTSFHIWVILIGSYLILRTGNYISKIKWIGVQVILEIGLLAMPFAYPIYIVATEMSSVQFEGVFLAYLSLGFLVSIYLLFRRSGVGSVWKIGAFLFAYLFALMIYAGSFAGQLTGVPFLITIAVDQLFRVAILTGYPAYLVYPPSEIYVSVSMTLAIPAIIFLALSAELAKSAARIAPQKGSTNIISNLKPAVLLLSLSAVIVLALTLPISLWVVTLNRQLVTLIPTISIAILVMLLVLISEKRDHEIS